MKFLQQLVFYCLLAGTGYLAIQYIFNAIFKTSHINLHFMQQIFAISSILVLCIVYKAYQVGELDSAYLAGIKWVLLSWIPYILVTVGYLILAKIQGRF